jgi:hypothetical protein
MVGYGAMDLKIYAKIAAATISLLQSIYIAV